ncbi:unnamed protein product [Adineta steineri]|uniref:Uncharacterized protein n=1 Tax=Adineta steineri TaxID=433720 RepID=A0A814GZ72_9BILA|nr:unnamed protein product [Adineta steineri]CAF1272009.1 unnamed protein product [Adineta steineri]
MLSLIVNISSQAAAAVDSLTRLIASELGLHQIWLELAGIGIGIGRNWSRIGWNWNWLELVEIDIELTQNV